MRYLISALALAALLFPATSQARGFYTSAYGGANWDEVISSEFIDSKTGFVIGGTLGTTIDSVPGLRIEADASFRQNQIDICGGYLTANHDTMALLANVAYDVPVNLGPVHPYVLAGVGYGHTEATFDSISLAKLERSGVAWQLGAGLNTAIADGVTAGVGYRYFVGPELNVFGTNVSDGSNHSLVAQVSFSFN